MSDQNKEKVHHVPYILNGELYKIIQQIGKTIIVRCVNCPEKKIFRGSIHSTGNFHMHIKRKHPEFLQRLHELKLNSIISRRELMLKEKLRPSKIKKLVTNLKVSSSSSNFVSEEDTCLPNVVPVPTNTNLECNNFTPLDLSFKNIFTGNVSQNNASDVIPTTSSMTGSYTLHNIVSRLETVLKGIEHEMHARNQLESNRIYFELAKFKFLHPDFAYN